MKPRLPLILLVFTGFYWFFFSGSPWVFQVFTEFYRVSGGFHEVNLVSAESVMNGTPFHCDCTGFYRILLGFSRLPWVLQGFTEFYRVLPSCTEFLGRSMAAAAAFSQWETFLKRQLLALIGFTGFCFVFCVFFSTEIGRVFLYFSHPLVPIPIKESRTGFT